MNEDEFRKAFSTLAGTPGHFPWQWELYKRFVAGDIPPSCNLPTGLGKTSVIHVWLLALATNPKALPRRLVYVVNRRTVVDQTTNEVENLRKLLPDVPRVAESLWALCSTRPEKPDAEKDRPLAISTLRGQFADNRAWSADPSRPAVICGTVDMIGSRLLFSGYGCGFKTRPLHAGFLGQDALLVHDEAHLEPAFQELLLAIEKEQRRCKDFSPLKVMELTATSRAGGEAFELTPKEKEPPATIPDPPTEPIHRVWRRLKAKKGLQFHDEKRGEVAKRIGKIARTYATKDSAVLVFVRTIDDVKTVQDILTDKKNGGVEKDRVQALTGTLRGLERDRLAKEDKVFARFMPEPKVTPKPGSVFLVCTSAGEVGVDISADHMVCDLTTLDSMAQRLGRVNRRGDGAAVVDVVFENDPDAKKKDEPFEKARWKTKELLGRLPVCDWIAERREASPLTLRNLKPTEDERKAAFAPPPVILSTSDILFDSWALTTVHELPGRPPVEPYLHGVEDDKQRETQVAWRAEVSLFESAGVSEKQIGELLDEFPLRPHELLRDKTDRVQGHLAELAKEHGDLPVWVIEPDDTVCVLALAELAEENNKGYVVNLSSRTVVLPPAAGGLTETGTLDGKVEHDAARRYDVGGWFIPASGVPLVRLLVSLREGELTYKSFADIRELKGELEFQLDEKATREPEAKAIRAKCVEVGLKPMRVASRLDLGCEDEKTDGDTQYLILKAERTKPEAKEPAAWPALVGHCEGVKSFADAICSRLNLSPEEAHIATAARLAALWHDLGKDRAVWQRGAGNVRDAEPVAKTLHGRPPENLNGFRHELASLVDVSCDPTYHATFREESEECRELLLHLIATHHGRGRPHFPAKEADDPERPGGAACAIVTETPKRFARLQRKYGRWGLAYLESLLRAADTLDSKRIEETPIGARVPGRWRDVSVGFAVPPSVAPPVPSISVNVDPSNPGQFFACCGLLELADRLWPGAEGWFADGKFHVTCGGTLDTLLSHLLMDAPEEAMCYADGVVAAPLLAPIRLTFDGGASTGIVLDVWGRVAREKKKVLVQSNPPWNFWSGQQTSRGIWEDMREALARQLAEKKVGFTNDLLSPTVPMTGRFGFDPRAAWNALDVGFSPDKQLIPVATSPATEMLTAVGLQRFRPQLSEDNESFIYSTWGLPLGVAVAPPAAAGLVRVPSQLTFRGRIMSRAKYSAFGFAKPITGANDE